MTPTSIRRWSVAAAAALALFATGSGALAQDARFEAPAAGGYRLANEAVALEVGEDSVVFRSLRTHAAGIPTSVEWRLESVARGAARLDLADRPRAASLADPARLVVRADQDVEEIYEPRGSEIEQSFRLWRLPGGPGAAGDVVLTGRFSGGLTPVAGDEAGRAGVALVAGATPVLSYGAATAIDADGRRLEAVMTVEGDRVQIALDAAWVAEAKLPILVDPIIGSAVTISTATTKELKPDTAYSVTSDAYIMVYEEEKPASTERRVMARRYTALGAAVDAAPFAVFDTTGVDVASPKVAWLGGGQDRYLVVWIQRTAPISVRGAIVSNISSATPTIAPMAAAISTFQTGETDLANVSVGGRNDATLAWLVAWETIAGTDRNIRSQRVDPAGALTGAQINLAVVAGTVEKDPAVNKMSTGGNKWIIAFNQFLSATDWNVRAVWVSTAGGLTTASTASFATTIEEHPAVAGVGPEYLVAFELTSATTGDRDLKAIRYTQTATTGGLQDVAISATDDDRDPCVAATGNDYLVAWSRAASPSATATDVWFQRYDTTFLLREAFTQATADGASSNPAAVGRAGIVGLAEYALAWETVIGGGPDANPRFIRNGSSLPPTLEVRETSNTGTIVNNGAPASGLSARYFGAVQVTASATAPATIVIRNTGAGVLNLGTPFSSNNGDFSLNLAQFGNTVQPGFGVTLTATFDPLTEGGKTATITFTHNATTGSAPQLSPFSFELKGIGLNGPAPAVDAGDANIAQIPDADTVTGVESTVWMPALGDVMNVTVTVDITHPRDDNVDIFLLGPNGFQLTLSDDNGGTTGQNYTGTIFDDAAATAITAGTAPFTGRFRPEGTNGFKNFRGVPSQGPWTLIVQDDLSTSVGTLNSWSLHLEVAPGAPPAAGFTIREGSATATAIVSGAPASGGRKFGYHVIGSRTPVDYVIANNGTAALTLGLPGSSHPDFTIDTTAFSTSVPAGGTTIFTLAYEPTTTGQRAAAITFTQSSAVQGATFTLNTTGYGLLQPPTTASFASSTSFPIPDSTPSGVTSTVHCSLFGEVLDVQVTGLAITHTFDGDLDIFLVAPDGTVVELCTDNGGTAENFVDTAFSDAASLPITSGTPPYTGTFRPEQPLSGFTGRPANGTWGLFVRDDAGGDLGTLNGWTLVVTSTLAGPPSPGIAFKEHASGLGFGNGAAPAGARDFGDVPTGTATPVTIRIENPGTGSVKVSQPVLTGRNAGDFQITSAPGLFSVDIPPAGSVTFTAVFAPTGAGPKQAWVEVAHDAVSATASPFRFAVEGRAVPVPSATFTAISTDVPKAIIDLATVTSTVTLALAGTILDVDVSIDIIHDSDSDLDIFLVHPDGTRVELSTDNGGTGFDYLGTRFDDAAPTAITAGTPPFTGRFRPEGSLAALIGRPVAGTWRLEVTDDLATDVGSIEGWSLSIASVDGAHPGIEVREVEGGKAVVANGAAAAGTRRFGDAEVGATPAARLFEVRNPGAAPLSVSVLAPTGPAAADFLVDASALPARIPAGGSGTFALRFMPAQLGAREAALTLIHDATLFETAPFTLGLAGEGIAAFANPHTFASTDTPTAIPDAKPAGVSLAIPVNAPGYVSGLRVKLSILHTFDSELDVYLIAPDGTQVELTTDNGGSGDNYIDTIFDDAASALVTGGTAPFTGTYKPEQPLSAFAFRPAAGVWTLNVVDDATTDIGTVIAAELEIATTLVGQPRFAVREGGPAGAVVATGGARDLGTAQTGTTGAVVTYRVENPGSAALDIAGLAITGADAGHFQLGTTGFPAQIAAGGAASFTVSFAPTSIGPKAARLALSHDATATAASPFTVDLNGTSFDQAVTETNATPTAIPDPGTILSTIDVAQTGGILDVNVTIDIAHTDTADLDIFLIAPDGTRVELATDVNAGGDNYAGTTFDDAAATAITAAIAPFAGTFRPEGKLAVLNGKDMRGTWTLEVTDDLSSDSGTLVSWSLDVRAANGLFPIVEVREAAPSSAVVLDGAAATGARNFNLQVLNQTTAPTRIEVRNAGAGTVTLGAPTLSGPDAAEFAIDATGFATTVAGGGTTSFGVTFRPTTAGFKAATVTFTHDATIAQASPFGFDVRGEGVGSLAAAQPLASADTPIAIPDAPSAGIRAVIWSNLPGGVADLDVRVTVTHAAATHLDMFLVGPDGTQVELSTDNGGTGGFSGTIFDDAAASAITAGPQPYTGRFRPETPLSAFNHRLAAGPWVLTIADDTTGTVGSLLAFQLDFTTTQTPLPLVAVREGSPTGTAIAFGTAAAGGRFLPITQTGTASAPLTIAVVNPSAAVLTIATPTASSADFTVTGGPASIPPGGSSTFEVAFTPRAAGFHVQTISFAHDATSTATPFTFEVRGRALATPVHTFVGTDVPKAIPDNTIPGVFSTIQVTSSEFILDTLPKLSIDHLICSNLDIYLVHPDGTEVELSTDNASTVGYVDTVLDDGATVAVTAAPVPRTGHFRPESPLSALFGKPAGGIWRLRVDDDTSGNVGTLLKFELTLSTAPAFPTIAVREGSAAGAVVANGAAAAGGRDFSVQTVGGGPTGAVTIHVANVGPGDMHLGAPAVGGSGFAVDATGFQATVPPGGATTFKVSFDPAATGVESAVVSFAHDATLLTPAPFTFAVRGEGATAYPGTLTAASVPVSIPDNNPAGARATITVNQPGFVTSIRVRVGITHTFDSEVDMVLVAPDGTTVELSTDNGGGNDNYVDTVFDDAAADAITDTAVAVSPFTGTFRPETPLSALLNRRATGTWTLFVADDGTGDLGTIDVFELDLGIAASAPAILEVREGATLVASGDPAAGARAFGNVGVNAGASAPVTLTLTNAGGSPIALGAPARGGSNPNEFILNASGFQSSLAPGASTSFAVSFDPQSAGAKAGTVQVAHTALGAAPFVVNLSGQGQANPPIAAVAQAPQVPKAIPDNNATGITSTISVPASGSYIVDARVTLNITHTFVADLDIFLISPRGTRVELTTDNGGTGDNFTSTVFDDAAATAITSIAAAGNPFTGSFRPETPLAALFGEDAAGTWTLEVKDDLGADTGTLQAWSIDITWAATPPSILRVNDGAASGPVVAHGAAGASAIFLGAGVMGQPPAQTRRIFLTNSGQGTATIQAPALGGAGAADFTVSAPGFPLALAAGQSGFFEVAITPVGAGSLAATVAFDHDATTLISSPFSFDVRGYGVVSAPVSTSAVNLPLTIPDAVTVAADARIDVAGPGNVVYATLTLSATHTFTGDLVFTLIHPDGTQVTLTSRNGGSGDHFTGTMFSDDAATPIAAGAAPFTGAFRPQSPLAALAGKPVQGTWILRALDASTGAAGTLTAAVLELGLSPAPQLDVIESGSGSAIANGAPAAAGRAFGGQPVAGGPAAPVTIVVRNTGTAVLNVGPPQIAGAGAFTLDLAGFNGNIGAGAQSSFAVGFDPSGPGPVSATVSFTHTAGAGGTFAFGVSGEGTVPQIRVQEGKLRTHAPGGTIAFGTRATRDGPSAPRTIEVVNTGAAPLTVGTPAIGGAHASDFAFTLAAGSSATLAPGATARLLFTFDPSAVGPRSAEVAFTHDGVNAASPFTLNLTGEGVLSLTTGGSSGGGGGGGCNAVPGAADPTLPGVLVLALMATGVRTVRRRRA